MKMLKLLLFPFCIFGIMNVSAQTASKSEQALYDLMDSGFLKTYKDYRYEVEKNIAVIKARQGDYQPEEIAEMRMTYLRTSEAFEDFIYVTRNDFLNRKTRKLIRKDTEGYVRVRLEKLNDIYVEYYIGKFMPVYTAMNIDESAMIAEGGNRTSIPPEIPLTLIVPVAKATMELIEFLDNQNDKDIAYLKDLLEKEWVRPNRFRDWEEI
ncbi:MAG: hypothetical protein SF052_00790 [Bacteroidia bacterium]|nr:hypothetical protein [Bacteroidia bacterium]